ncbi:MAG: S41 family peptidase [Planctomycetota bacterium]|jgi:carboxyl-terminal processing protease
MNAIQTGAQRTWLTAALVAVVAAIPAAAVKAGPQQSASQEVWSQSLQLIRTGQFDSAAARLSDLEQIGTQGARLASLLRDRQTMEQTRRQMTQADLEKYITWAKEEHAKDKLHRAISYAVMAFENTAETDKNAFRAQKWLSALYDDALVRASEQRGEGEWLDAHRIYYQLSDIFEHDKDLEKLRRECLTHARLEVTYKPDGKWQDYLMGIEWRMATKALDRIANYYVTDVDFRELTIAGLEQLLLLARSPSLQEVFPSLGDQFDREDFIARIDKRISQAREVSRFTAGDAADFFRRAGDINLQTVQLPEAVIVSEFMDGTMATLDDFSTLIWPVEFREFDKRTRGDFIGVGISIAKMNNEITVVTPLDDSPAYYAGILADDVIVGVDDQSTEDMSLTKAVEVITGPINTSVTLTIRRKVDGVDKEIDFELRRDRVVLNSVKGCRRDADDPQRWNHMIDPELGIGYIRVGGFQGNTVAQLRKTVEHLRRDAGLEALILDLRFNPGGLLRSAVEMTELFLAKDDKIVSTRGERGRDWPISAERTGPFVDLALVILINEASASASEIVSGALQDHDRATVIGERTFGKGSVQNLIQLDGTEAHLKLTTAAYYLPSGRSLHRDDDATTWGVNPEVVVPLVPKEWNKVIAMRRKADVLAPAGSVATPKSEPSPDQAGDAEPGPASDDTEASPAPEPTTGGPGDKDAPGTEPEEDDPPRPDPNDRPEVDPQLETALLVMRAQRLAELAPQVALQNPDEATVGVNK